MFSSPCIQLGGGTMFTGGGVIRLGELYRTGVYYISVQQGKEYKELKVIKLRD